MAAAWRIGASGLRSSCASVARNSSLRRSASSSSRSCCLALRDVREPDREIAVERRGDDVIPVVCCRRPRTAARLCAHLVASRALRRTCSNRAAIVPGARQHFGHHAPDEIAGLQRMTIAAAVLRYTKRKSTILPGLIAHRRQHDERHARGLEHRLEAPVALAHQFFGARALDEHRRLARADVGDAHFAFRGPARLRRSSTVSAPSTCAVTADERRRMHARVCPRPRADLAQLAQRGSCSASSTMTPLFADAQASPRAPAESRTSRRCSRARARTRCSPRPAASPRAAIEGGDDAPFRAMHAHERRQDQLELFRQRRDATRASPTARAVRAGPRVRGARSSGSSRRPGSP